MRTLLKAVLLPVALGACAAAPPAGSPPPPSPEAAWPYWPVRLRVHPLTRLAVDPNTGERVLEARIELRDADEITTRGVGLIELELLGEPGSAPLDRWEIDLSDLGANTQHFDAVTRTYLFKLRLSADHDLSDCAIRARLDSADGRLLSAALRLEE